jgi:hypothetical protein
VCGVGCRLRHIHQRGLGRLTTSPREIEAYHAKAQIAELRPLVGRERAIGPV